LLVLGGRFLRAAAGRGGPDSRSPSRKRTGRQAFWLSDAALRLAVPSRTRYFAEAHIANRGREQAM